MNERKRKIMLTTCLIHSLFWTKRNENETEHENQSSQSLFPWDSTYIQCVMDIKSWSQTHDEDYGYLFLSLSSVEYVMQNQEGSQSSWSTCSVRSSFSLASSSSYLCPASTLSTVPLRIVSFGSNKREEFQCPQLKL